MHIHRYSPDTENLKGISILPHVDLLFDHEDESYRLCFGWGFWHFMTCFGEREP